MRTRLITLAVGTFAIGIDVLVTASLVAPMSRDLQVSESAAGQLVTVFALSYAILSPLLAALTARMSRKHVLLAALTLFVLGNVATALAPTYALVMASRVVAAAGASLYTPNASAVAAAIAPPESMGRAIATVMGGLTVATALGVPIGSFIGGTMNWRATMWLVAALGAIALVGVTRAIPHIQLPIPTKLRDRLAPLGDRRVVAALALAMLVFSSFYTLYTYLGPVLNPATGGNATKLSVLLCVYGSMAVVGTTIGGKLADTRDPRKVRFTALACFAAVLAMVPVGRHWFIGALVWVALLGVPSVIQYVSHLKLLVELVPQATPLLLGLNASAQYLGMGIGGAVGGAALGAWGPSSLGWISTTFLLAAVVLALAALRHPASFPQSTAPEAASVRGRSAMPG
ncbi:MFS transporter [Streptomyces sp. NPDC058086]|uniref:MFS transporter n=1 Tax=Streptomyces sp. NPDC058086 TaxID=3346334 RepID=UPI0036E3C0C8